MSSLLRAGVRARREIVGEMGLRLAAAGLSIANLSGALSSASSSQATATTVSSTLERTDQAGAVLSGVGLSKDLIKVANYARRLARDPESSLKIALEQIDRRADRAEANPTRSFAALASGATTNVFTGLAGSAHPIEISRNVKAAEAAAVSALKTVVSAHDALTVGVDELREVEGAIDRTRAFLEDNMERGQPTGDAPKRLTQLETRRGQKAADLADKIDEFETLMDARTAFADLLLAAKTAQSALKSEIRPHNVERNTRLAETGYDALRGSGNRHRCCPRRADVQRPRSPSQ